MKVYVANCTQQRQIINYRLPESRKPMSQAIEIGKQKMIGDLSTPEIEAVEKQLGPYGLVPVTDIKRSRKKITYVYSIGSYVSAANIIAAVERNKAILREEGKKRREEAAIAANLGMNTEDTPLNRLEMTIEEESSGSIPSEHPVGEGFRIDNTLVTSENKRPRSRSARVLHS